ncbi:hypothetical protein [Prosthecobacter sp.]|uniref:hypothetical protein n=1 Tax=Prosthecobacter sp. TaxID=1965333 RepID=UPI003783F35A
MTSISVLRRGLIKPLTEWPLPGESDAWSYVETHCKALLESAAFQRLRNITFLGILAPRFRALEGHPIFSRSHIKKTDGTRADHSVGVSHLFSELVHSMGLGKEAEKYAMVWGLVHDISTWALSHTSEPAFTAITGISTHELRHMMILGDRRLPSRFELTQQLKEIGIMPSQLAQLFDKSAYISNSTIKLPTNLEMIREIARSPITPDSIEGMFRSGHVLGVSVPKPSKFSHILHGGCLFPSFSGDSAGNRKNVVRFWEAKSKIYSEYINSLQSIRWESAWSKAIERVYYDISLGDSLELSESDIIAQVLKEGLSETTLQFRYKAPLKYIVNQDQTKLLNRSPLLKDLNRVLTKEKT